MTRRTNRVVGFAAGLVVVVGWIAIGPAQLGGRSSYVTTHGISMEPRFHSGDLAVIRTTSSYKVGDVAAYRSDLLRTVVMHRIVAVRDGRYTFKGDNNSWFDPQPPSRDKIVGKLSVRIPRGGVWLHRLTAPPLLATYALLALLLGGTAANRTRRPRRKDQRTMSARHRAKPAITLSSLPPSLTPVVAGVAAIAVLGAAVSGLAWTRPTKQVVAAAASTTSSMRFSYVAHVPRSAAYDGTTVIAPQPVFRKLTNGVDVTYSYTGLPGALTVTTELSTAGGWLTTIPLTRAAVGRTFAGTIHLDLAALQRRADAAAQATGLPAGEVSLAVVPQVSLAGGGSFAPRLELSLTDLVLKTTSALTASSSTKISGSRLGRTRIGAFGHAVAVATARTAGAFALLLAVLAAVVLAAIARMHGPVAEAERVRARYSELILPVLPVVLAAGRPVVDVPDIDSLARLADRYGLLVLHWSRGGIDTYVVQDEGTTFRYRTGGPTHERAAQPAVVGSQTSARSRGC